MNENIENILCNYSIGKILMMEPINKGWKERNNGIMAGMPNEEAETVFPGLYFNTLGMEERYPGRESPREFFNRIEKSFYKLGDEVSTNNEDVLVVTHGE